LLRESPEVRKINKTRNNNQEQITNLKPYIVKKTMFISLTSAIVLMTSCSKKNSDPAPPPATASIEGYWVGKYNSTGGGQDNMSMLFKPGGVLRVYELGTSTDTTTLSPLSRATGEWIKVGNSVQTTYKSGPAIITTSKVLNTANSQMTGTWAMNGITRGFIELNK
jgi:hypothetical protein